VRVGVTPRKKRVRSAVVVERVSCLFGAMHRIQETNTTGRVVFKLCPASLHTRWPMNRLKNFERHNYVFSSWFFVGHTTGVSDSSKEMKVHHRFAIHGVSLHHPLLLWMCVCVCVCVCVV
jgi:hypothetical protein